MARTQRFKVAQIEEALRKGLGVYVAAAKILRCSPNTVKNYVNRNPKLQRLRDELVEETIDRAEITLLTAIQNGNLQAATFYLRTKGRHRGYGDKVEVGGEVGVRHVNFEGAPLERVRREAAWDEDDDVPAPPNRGIPPAEPRN